jgi:hypothetical protein
VGMAARAEVASLVSMPVKIGQRSEEVVKGP